MFFSFRVESAHWSLKKVLGNSMGDLCSCWDGIHNIVILQHNKIKASFEQSLLLTSDLFKGYRFRHIIGRVSQYALDLIAKELEKSPADRIGFINVWMRIEMYIWSPLCM